MKRIVCWSLGALLLANAGMALAADPPKATERQSKIKGKTGGQIRVDSTDKSSGSGTDLADIDIEGRIYKPSVFYVMERSNIQYTGIDFKQNFTDRIVKGAAKRPF